MALQIASGWNDFNMQYIIMDFFYGFMDSAYTLPMWHIFIYRSRSTCNLRLTWINRLGNRLVNGGCVRTLYNQITLSSQFLDGGNYSFEVWVLSLSGGFQYSFEVGTEQTVKFFWHVMFINLSLGPFEFEWSACIFDYLTTCWLTVSRLGRRLLPAWQPLDKALS